MAREKARIDRGDHGDKVPGFDPGAAPLGTDEEAGGSSPVPDSAMRTRTHPELPPGQTTAFENSIAPDAAPSKANGSRHVGAIILAVVVALAIVLAWLLLGR